MHKVSRREFVRIGGLTAAATVAAACAKPAAETDPTAAPAPTTAPAAQPTAAPATSNYKEAPKLAELVAAGTLPPVDERLPENPCVIPVQEMTGKYGGVLRRGFKGVSDGNGPSKVISQALTWYNPDLSVRPNLCESFELNEDATVWTVHLRAGTKYSDGTPFTTKDVEWYMTNLHGHPDLSPSFNRRFAWGSPRKAAELNVIDDFTFTLTYGEPKPLFPFDMAMGRPWVPSHYLEQFHPDFNDEADLMAAADALGLGTLKDYWGDRSSWRTNPEVPLLYPWTPDGLLSEELHIMSRNPYCWQVDEDGNQLPYIDEVHHRIFETPDIFNMWIVNGEVDMQRRHVDVANFTLFKENEENGDYRVAVGSASGHSAIQLNLTTKDEKLRAFFNDRKVREAFMLAINRQEVNELVYDGQCTPRQYSPMTVSPQYYAEMSNTHIEFDPDRSRELLTEAGYVDSDGDGFVEYPDGSSLSFQIEGTAPGGSAGEDECQLVTGFLKDVGVNCSYKYFERSLYTEHFEANDIEAAWWGGDRTLLPISAPWIFTGTMIDRPWACAWGIYYNNSQDETFPNAEKPPEGHWIWDIWDNWEKMIKEPDDAARDQLFRNICDIWIEEIPMIGVLGEFPAVIIIKNGMRNLIGDGMPIDNETYDEHLPGTQTCFWEDPTAHGA